ncbi:MAG: DUF916 and DUF3324 domain-containing protein [Oscillospiraceae bacterium]|nr:DUF916 and DUF3324 domain-containing protein [Oscillospiraceae bacterium]
MRKALKISAIVTVFLTTMLALAITAGAGMGGFAVTPNIPDNQVPGNDAHLDIIVSPGGQYVVEITIMNVHEDEDIFLTARLFTAGTNMNGVMDYFPEVITDDSIPFRFDEIATLPPGADHIELPPRGYARVPITLNIPNEPFDGVVLGAVNVLLGITDEDRAEAGMFVSRFASNAPVRIRMNNDVDVEPDFYLGESRAEVVSSRGSFVLDVHNLSPRISRGAVANAWVYPAGSDTPIFASGAVGVDFAPNAIFPLTMMDRAGYGIHPGDYLARVRIEYDGRVWEFERGFNVAPAQAANISEEAVFVQQQAPLIAPTGISLVTLLIILGILLLLALIIYLILKSRKDKQNQQQQMDWSRMQMPPQYPGQPGMPQQPIMPPQQPPTAPGDSNNATLNQLKGMDQDQLAKLLAQMQQKKSDGENKSE